MILSISTQSLATITKTVQQSGSKVSSIIQASHMTSIRKLLPIGNKNALFMSVQSDFSLVGRNKITGLGKALLPS